jgi:hypothetical protein
MDAVQVVAAAIILMIPLAACKKSSGAECIFNKECADDSVCFNAHAGAGACTQFPKAKAVCSGQKECKDIGWCSVSSFAREEPAMCTAVSNADCKNASVCKTKGQCRASGSNCIK